MKAYILIGACTFILLATGCFDWAKYNENISSMTNYELKAQHSHIQRRIDHLRSTAFFTTSSPYEIGYASSELDLLHQKQQIIEAEIRRRKLLVPGVSYGSEIFEYQ